MNEILQALTEPTVLSGVFLTILLQYVFKHLPSRIKLVLRANRLKEMRNLKRVRRSPEEIAYQTMKGQSYYLVFMGICALYLVLVTMGPLNVLLKSSTWITILVCSPVFIAEIAWLRQDSYAKELIKSKEKIRLKKVSQDWGLKD